jgi:hypothetical protein
MNKAERREYLKAWRKRHPEYRKGERERIQRKRSGYWPSSAWQAIVRKYLNA